MPALDGLRALFVGGVLLYHLTGARLPSATGEVGVIAFFSLSGFLITSLLAGEHVRTGTINIGAFFRRRAARLFPALFVLLLVWLCVAIAFGHHAWLTSVPAGGTGGPVSTKTALEATGAGALYVTNWIDAFPAANLWSGYAPLSHLWSLAVEEQFYLLWAPVMFVLLRFGRRITTWAIGVMALLFTLEPFALWHQGTDRIYFGTDTRMSALLCGALVACWTRSGHLGFMNRSRWSHIIAVASVTAMLVAGAGFRYQIFAWAWLGGLTAASIASAGVVAYVANRRQGSASALLSRRTIVWLGQRSYAIYLWGYVFNTWFRSLGALIAPVVLSLTLVTAELSFRLVERPLRARFRTARGGQDSRRQSRRLAPAPANLAPANLGPEAAA